MKLLFKTFPLTTNSLYAHVGRRRFLTQKARDNKQALGWEARGQFTGTPHIGLLSLKLAFWWPDKRKHDIDNLKTLLDSLTGIVWEDDSQIVELHVTKGVDRENPRLEMEVEKYRV